MPSLRDELTVAVPGDRRPGKKWTQGQQVVSAKPETNGTPIRIGYARCSTAQQELQSQLDALAAAHCTRVFSDKISTRIKIRPELEKALPLAHEIKTARAGPAGDPDRARAQTPRPQRRRTDDPLRPATERRSATGAADRTADRDLHPHGMGSTLFAVLAAQLDRDDIREKTLEGQRAAAAATTAAARR